MPLFGRPDVEKLAQKRDVKGLVKALRSKGRRLAEHAAEALVAIGAPAVEPLMGALKHRDKDVRWRAAYALGEIGDARAAESLVGALWDGGWRVGQAAATALGQIGGPEVEQALAEYPERQGRRPL